jgi:hypothetical protein
MPSAKAKAGMSVKSIWLIIPIGGQRKKRRLLILGLLVEEGAHHRHTGKGIVKGVTSSPGAKEKFMAR